jgi:hypothetical protein
MFSGGREHASYIFLQLVGDVLNRPLVVENFGGLNVATYVFMDAVILTSVSVYNSKVKWILFFCIECALLLLNHICINIRIKYFQC